ncbi:hypothetical protein CEUSTIGMA_g5080.t1, partial [Chlamydomonas eustigma]
MQSPEFVSSKTPLSTCARTSSRSKNKRTPWWEAGKSEGQPVNKFALDDFVAKEETRSIPIFRNGSASRPTSEAGADRKNQVADASNAATAVHLTNGKAAPVSRTPVIRTTSCPLKHTLNKEVECVDSWPGKPQQPLSSQQPPITLTSQVPLLSPHRGTLKDSRLSFSCEKPAASLKDVDLAGNRIRNSVRSATGGEAASAETRQHLQLHEGSADVRKLPPNQHLPTVEEPGCAAALDTNCVVENAIADAVMGHDAGAKRERKGSKKVVPLHAPTGATAPQGNTVPPSMPGIAPSGRPRRATAELAMRRIKGDGTAPADLFAPKKTLVAAPAAAAAYAMGTVKEVTASYSKPTASRGVVFGVESKGSARQRRGPRSNGRGATQTSSLEPQDSALHMLCAAAELTSSALTLQQMGQQGAAQADHRHGSTAAAAAAVAPSAVPASLASSEDVMPKGRRILRRRAEDIKVQQQKILSGEVISAPAAGTEAVHISAPAAGTEAVHKTTLKNSAESAPENSTKPGVVGDDKDGGAARGRGRKRTGLSSAGVAAAGSLTELEDEVLFLTKKAAKVLPLPRMKTAAVKVSNIEITALAPPAGPRTGDTSPADPESDPLRATAVDPKPVARPLSIKLRFKKKSSTSSKLEPSIEEQGKQGPYKDRDTPLSAAAAAAAAAATRQADTSPNPVAPPSPAVAPSHLPTPMELLGSQEQSHVEEAMELLGSQEQSHVKEAMELLGSQEQSHVEKAVLISEVPASQFRTVPLVREDSADSELPSPPRDSTHGGGRDILLEPAREGRSGGDGGVHDLTDYVPSSQLDPSLESGGEEEEIHTLASRTQRHSDPVASLAFNMGIAAVESQPGGLSPGAVFHDVPGSQTGKAAPPFSFSKLAKATGFVGRSAGGTKRVGAAVSAARSPQLPFLVKGARGSTPMRKGSSSSMLSAMHQARLRCEEEEEEEEECARDAFDFDLQDQDNQKGVMHTSGQHADATQQRQQQHQHGSPSFSSLRTHSADGWLHKGGSAGSAGRGNVGTRQGLEISHLDAEGFAVPGPVSKSAVGCGDMPLRGVLREDVGIRQKGPQIISPPRSFPKPVSVDRAHTSAVQQPHGSYLDTLGPASLPGQYLMPSATDLSFDTYTSGSSRVGPGSLQRNQVLTHASKSAPAAATTAAATAATATAIDSLGELRREETHPAASSSGGGGGGRSIPHRGMQPRLGLHLPATSSASSEGRSGVAAVGGVSSGRPSVSAAGLLLERIMRESESRKTSKRALQEEDDWGPEETSSLQMAYFKVEPTHPLFWQEVAKRVPGRTAGECFSKVHDRRLPPEARSKMRGITRKAEALPSMVHEQRSALSQGSQGPVPMKKPTLSKARKWAREMQMQAQLERLATQSGSQEECAGRSAASSLLSENPDLAEAIKVKEHADRYISTYLRKAGGWNRWQRTCKEGQERRLRGAVVAAGQVPRSLQVTSGGSYLLPRVTGGDGRRGFQQGSTGVTSQAMLSLLHQGGAVDEESDGECEEGGGEGGGYEEEEDLMW